MLWLLVTGLVLATLGYFYTRGRTAGPPTAWLSFLPPIIDYGRDPVSFLLRAREKYGDVFCIPAPTFSMTFVFGQPNVRAFYESSDEALSISRGIGRLMLHVFGPLFLMLPPEFEDAATASFLKNLHQSSALSVYRPGFEEVMRQGIQCLASLPSFDVLREMSELVVRLTLRMALGEPGLAATGDVVAPRWKDMEDAAFDPLTLMAPWLPFGPPAVFRRLRNAVYDPLDRAVDWLVNQPPEDSYLALMLRDKSVDLAGKYRDYLKSHIRIIVFAGHINTASTVTWMLARLTENPEAERWAREEQMQAGGDLSMDAFAKMPFLDACLRETFRDMGLLSVMRLVMTPFTTASGVVVPAGHLLMLSPKAIQSDPTVWPIPGKWDPDRFDTVQRQQQLRSSLTYLPFGHGMHFCKGEKIATFEIKWIVCTLLRRFKIHRISPAQPLQPDYTRPTAGLPAPKTPLILRLEAMSPGVSLPNSSAVHAS